MRSSAEVCAFIWKMYVYLIAWRTARGLERNVRGNCGIREGTNRLVS